jgi:hypothetical protein
MSAGRRDADMQIKIDKARSEWMQTGLLRCYKFVLKSYYTDMDKAPSFNEFWEMVKKIWLSDDLDLPF